MVHLYYNIYSIVMGYRIRISGLIEYLTRGTNRLQNIGIRFDIMIIS